MHANSGLRVLLEWKINRPDSVITAVICFRNMEFKSLYSYCKFGACCRFLQDVTHTTYTARGPNNVEANLNTFFQFLEELGLPVTTRVAESQLGELKVAIEDYEEGKRISAAHATELKTAIKLIRTTLDAEIKDVGAYSPTAKRIDLQKLLDEVPKLFAPTVFDALPDVARFDLNEAGKCIAFERPTAAAFHILRATEDVLRYYYRISVRSKRIKSLNCCLLYTSPSPRD